MPNLYATVIKARSEFHVTNAIIRFLFDVRSVDVLF